MPHPIWFLVAIALIAVDLIDVFKLLLAPHTRLEKFAFYFMFPATIPLLLWSSGLVG